MAKNDTVLIDGILSEKVAAGMPASEISEAFEYLSFEQILKDYDLSQDAIESGWVDGKFDGGIDGIFLFINGHLVHDIDQLIWPKTNSAIDLFIITCKHHETFKESPLNTLLATSQEFFDFSLTATELKGKYSRKVTAHRTRFVDAYKKLAITNPHVNIYFYYVSRGDTNEIGESIIARSRQIGEIINKLFSSVEYHFLFWGAKELVDRCRLTKQFSLELGFQDYLSGSGEGYIAVVKLYDYFQFVSDDNGTLRRYLFDSNIRDYLGENKVNDDITASLNHEFVPDFWWLNNGITILATRAAINGKQFLLRDIQIVNGLQTTETLFRHFASGSLISKDRTLSVKIIVSSDEGLRDQIIRATNNQSVVEQAALHATDKIQRDIEQILESHNWYYERRKNYYKNIGRPSDRLISPLFLAGGFVAVCLKDPITAGSLRARFMRNESSYRAVFSDKAPIEVWPRIAAILKAAEREVLAAPRSPGSFGDRFLRSWRGLAGLLYVARSAGKFSYGFTDLLAIDPHNINLEEIRDCWDAILAHRGGASRVTLTRAQQICADFSEKYSLRDIQAVRKKSLTSSRRIGRPGPSADFLVSQSDWQEFLSQVDMLLTEQPWPRGIHIEVAEKLHAKKSNVALAIDQLIAAGKYYQQVDGLLFDSDGNEVLLEPKIENSDPQ